MTGICFVGVLDTTGFLFVVIPLAVFLIIGLAGLGLGFVLLKPVRKFVKQVLNAETTELDKLAGKMGKCLHKTFGQVVSHKSKFIVGSI